MGEPDDNNLEDKIKKLEKVVEQKDSHLRSLQHVATHYEIILESIHNVRNLVGAIMGYSDLAITDNETTKHNEYLREIYELCEHSKELLDAVLKPGYNPKKENNIDINEIITNSISYIQPLYRGKKKIKEYYDENLPKLKEAVPIYLEDVFLNILKNAYDAIKEQQEGFIAIRTYSEENNICVEITNTGPPIDASIRELLFQPFVKAKDGGTGLGLASCKQIVEEHGGTIEVTSDYRGFIVKFPDEN